ncbi:MAG: pyruvate ferredoxin oxidoreductase [candidate division Zixibacteria bacterium]|nr:pyruvate ferredoxin oxidoreductase [candidate division Zixibacteria bacterium]
MNRVMSGNEAVSQAVKLSRVQVISAYPITPQTSISEKLSEICGSGEMDAKFVKVESEHSAMATLIGASSTGVRTFTATSSQGLALMQELLFWVSGARLPVVMVNVNRAMAAPWTIWCDQTDSVSQRDTGWLQFYCWSNQEILDSVICAFKIAEELLIPCMVCHDGFFISHTHEVIDIPEQEQVDTFLSPRKAEYKLDTSDPRTFSGGTMPNMFMEFRYKVQAAFERAQGVIDQTYKQFAQTFGRDYRAVEAYYADDAEILLIASGSAASTVYHTVRQMRESGRKVGLLRLRQLRPLPVEGVLNHLTNEATIAVIDRNLSPGTGGVFTQELRAALHRNGEDCCIHEFVAGLGGRDITAADIEKICDDLDNKTADPAGINWVGLNR